MWCHWFYGIEVHILKTIKSILIVAQIEIPKLNVDMKKNWELKKIYEIMKICFNYGHSIAPLVRYSFLKEKISMNFCYFMLHYI
jgi:hypothetical protein